MIEQWLEKKVSLWEFVKTSALLKPIRVWLALVLVILVFSKAFLALNAIFISYVIDGHLKGGFNTPLLQGILATAGVVVFFGVYKGIESILNPLGKWLEQKIDTTVESVIVEEAVESLMKLPRSAWQGASETQVALRLNVKKDVRMLFFLIYGNLLPAVLEIGLALFALWYLGVFSHVWVLLCSAVAYLWIMVVLVPKMNNTFLAQTRTEGRLTNSLVRLLHLAPIAKVYGSTPLFFKEYEAQLEQEGAAFLDRLKAISLAEVVPSLVLALGLSWIFYSGLLAMQGGQLSVGVFSALFAISATVLGNLKHLVFVFSGLLDGAGRVSFPLVCQKEAIKALGQKEPCVGGGFLGLDSVAGDGAPLIVSQSIVFENVSVSKGGVVILKALSFTIPAGEKVWLVGASGAGKSTLIELLGGFLEYEGRILIDGKRLSPEQFFCALVPQGGSILKGSVRFNLKIGHQSATDEQMRECLRKVDLLDVIEARGGLDMLVSEKNFSGGQLQRLSIARALLSERSVIVMDEPSSALDARSQRSLVQLIERIPATTVVSMHRLEAIPSEGRVLVLRGGELVMDTVGSKLDKDMLKQ